MVDAAADMVGVLEDVSDALGDTVTEIVSTPLDTIQDVTGVDTDAVSEVRS